MLFFSFLICFESANTGAARPKMRNSAIKEERFQAIQLGVQRRLRDHDEGASCVASHSAFLARPAEARHAGHVFGDDDGARLDFIDESGG